MKSVSSFIIFIHIKAPVLIQNSCSADTSDRCTKGIKCRTESCRILVEGSRHGGSNGQIFCHL